jgi:pimeloyl-ACP methyl ester carboxylesterase
VHGLTSFRQAWDPVTDLLAADFTCVRVDLRGHGGSSAASEYSMPSLVGDVRAVIEEPALGDPALVGHSLGVTVAAVYAAAYGARAVVCVDSSLRFGDFAGVAQSQADAPTGGCGPPDMRDLLVVQRPSRDDEAIDDSTRTIAALSSRTARSPS